MIIKSEVLATMQQLAYEAGEIMLSNIGEDFGIYKKADNSRVTDIDLQISKHIQTQVAEKLPEVLLFSEEFDQRELDLSKPTLIVDELDGTSAYIEGKKGYSHQSAYYDPQDGLCIGLIYHPWNDTMLYAVKGQGAFLKIGDKVDKLEMPAPKKMGEYRYAKPYRYRGSKYNRLLDKLKVCPGQILPTDSTRTLQMLQGELDVNIMLIAQIPQWDWACEKVILEEVGFHHSYLNGETVEFGPPPSKENTGYLVCRPEVASKLLQDVNAALE